MWKEAGLLGSPTQFRPKQLKRGVHERFEVFELMTYWWTWLR